MNRGALDVAIYEAKKFMDLACQLRALDVLRRKSEPETKTWRDVVVNEPKVSGALRRSSLDLTRALAAMRRP